MGKADKFQVGQLVRLKSKGPVMTVNSADLPHAPNAVECVWFVHEKLNQGRFAADTLDLVDDTSDDDDDK